MDCKGFASSFDMKKAWVGDIEMDKNIDFIAETTHLPFEREKWSKNCAMCDIPSKKLTISNVCGYHVNGMFDFLSEI